MRAGQCTQGFATRPGAEYKGRTNQGSANAEGVVSGGSRGIGRAIAIAFAREGARTVLAAANSANLAKGANAVAAAGGPQAVTVAGDLRTLEACEQVFARVNEHFKRCDVLVRLRPSVAIFSSSLMPCGPTALR
jgi:enoyl-[acyl-carrier-protein] reductase (NADH)